MSTLNVILLTAIVSIFVTLLGNWISNKLSSKQINESNNVMLEAITTLINKKQIIDNEYRDIDSNPEKAVQYREDLNDAYGEFIVNLKESSTISEDLLVKASEFIGQYYPLPQCLNCGNSFDDNVSVCPVCGSRDILQKPPDPLSPRPSL